ncbi:Ger(x)C family spore germination protein [Paenibacillus humicola]|uniref:Ger(x)C family spore germination protein n=1 Tax=Paenibacillus humicola TaxID=3110540 RepID=UPI00237A6FC8|nr:Ger(x)C family spore germination protein [Paenibacillus humicola]
MHTDADRLAASRSLFIRLPLILAISALALTGCGDRAELPERAFVMGAALDESKNGKVLVTLQVYKPSQTIQAKGKSVNPYINIKAMDDTVAEAIHDITTHLGRKAQFSHMRVLLISERLVRKIKLASLLDFFYRDREPRMTSITIVTRGAASPYFDTKPFIESTSSQQYFLSERFASRFAGKSFESSLLKLAISLRSQTRSAGLPYMSLSPEEAGREPKVSGVAVIQDGLMKDRLTGTENEGLLMLMNKYKGGVIEVPCAEIKAGRPPQAHEAVEVLNLKADRSVGITAEGVNVAYKVRATVSAVELPCSNIDDIAGEREFEARVSDEINREMKLALRHLQRDKTDLLDIGNDVYRARPGLWKKWKSDWPERFASIKVRFDTDTLLLTQGRISGKPILEEKRNERR